MRRGQLHRSCARGRSRRREEQFLQRLASIDAYSQKTNNAPFAELPDEKKDAVITSMENGTALEFDNARAVFARFRRLTLEGMFSDPYYGGNTSFAVGT